MSQIAKGSSGVVPPGALTTLGANDGSEAVAVANKINVLGAGLPDPTVIDDNDDGIETYALPDGGPDFYVFLTNRKVGSASVVGATTSDLFTQNLGATPGVYNFQVYASGFNASTPAGCAFTIFGSIRTTGAAASIIVTQDLIADREPALLTVNLEILVSGNDVIVRATGVAGLTINFKVLANYIFVG